MASEEHLKQLEQGVTQWNEWRKQHPKIRPELSNADLNGIDLRGIDLSETNLDSANLSGTDLRIARLNRAKLHSADLHNANLRNADLIEADLSRIRLDGADLSGAHMRNANLSDGAYLRGAYMRYADLGGADLRGANLRDADLNGANLHSVNLYNANLNGAHLSLAKIQQTIFANVDLRQTKGLAQIQHEGPSIIQMYTIQLPQDGSALHFLRGAGVPDEWISDYRTHMMHPIQYQSCFISYSSKDDVLARRLHADLQDHGVRCWFAPEDMKIGDKIRARIDEAIHLQDKLLLLLSEQALASDWVEVEVEAALEKKQKREVLFPVRLDESVMQTSQAWAKQLCRARHIGDFTCWTDPQAYQVAFDRLLRDLKKTS